MAQAQDMSVARAVFISGLLRSEPNAPEISRDDATLFARTLLRTCNVCTTSNIKLCKSFVAKYVLPSNSRTAALVKYMITLSKSFAPRSPDIRMDTSKPGDDNEGLGNVGSSKVQQPPEPAFKRLYLLYIVHDILVFVHNHSRNHEDFGQRSFRADALEQLRPAIITLAVLAACGCNGSAAKTYSAVLEVLAFWKTQQIFPTYQLGHMHDRVLAADSTEWDSMLRELTAEEENKANDEKKLKQDGTKWRLPERHSVVNDPTAPWHELPAANGLYMKRTRGYPLRANALPFGGFQLRNGGYEASSELKKDVGNLYTEVVRCYDKYTNGEEVQDIDALGNIIWKDPDRPTRNYWGFTLDGIEKRKELAQSFAENTTGYDDFGPTFVTGDRVNDAVERARMLAAERGRGMGRGRGTSRPGWRGGRRR